MITPIQLRGPPDLVALMREHLGPELRESDGEHRCAVIADAPHSDTITALGERRGAAVPTVVVTTATDPRRRLRLLRAGTAEVVPTAELVQGRLPFAVSSALARAESAARLRREASDPNEERRRSTAKAVSDRAERALRESEGRLRLALSAASLGVYEWRAGTDRARWGNHRMFEIFGCPWEDVPLDLETFYDRVLVPEDRERFERCFAEAARSGNVLHLEYRIRRMADGALRWVETWARFEVDEAGRPERLIGVLADATERILSERASRENEIRFRTLADNIAQLAWIADEHGSLVWANRRWTEYTGRSLEEVMGDGWQVVQHPEHRERVVDKLERHFRTGEPWEDTFPMRSATGEYRWFLSRALPIREGDGKIVWWFGTNTDVTAQRQAEDALREADRRKDEFIAVLAHELRNPLAPVRNAVEVLRRTGTSDPRIERIHVIIARQVTHMARLIDDLLDVSRIQRGQLLLRCEPCDLGTIARQTAEDYRPSFEAAGLDLVIDIPDEPIAIYGDPIRVAQMLGNLLQNAARFTESGRAVLRATTDLARGCAAVTVLDTGIGMEKSLVERLFDPFAQAEQGLARQKGGLGLGLTLTRGLAELHGGTIAAYSPGPGRGSTFTLRLPLFAEGAIRGRPSQALRG